MENSDFVIQVHHLSKVYKLYDKPTDRLKEALFPFRTKPYHRDFYALRDVSFDVRPGETLGIIGKNGSGKSTLLKLITGVLTPTDGEVAVRGRISALLELGAGFNPEYSGLENVYLQGTMTGYSREEMEERVPAILQFADIGEFIDQPVKTYSSGMFTRLAFAVAVHVDPEILIVDEALSVGDSWFQHKCMARMRKLMEGGAAVLLVSHSIDAIRSLCQRAVWLDGGRVKRIGDSNSVTNDYMNEVFIEHNSIVMSETIQPRGADPESCAGEAAVLPAVDLGNQAIVEVVDVSILDAQGNATDKIVQGERFAIAVTCRAHQAIRHLSVGVLIKDQFGLELTGESIFNKRRQGLDLKAGQQFTARFASAMVLRGGQSYSVDVRLNQVSRWDRADNIVLYCDETAAVFEVLTDPEDPMWFKFRQNFEVEIREGVDAVLR